MKERRKEEMREGRKAGSNDEGRNQ